MLYKPSLKKCMISNLRIMSNSKIKDIVLMVVLFIVVIGFTSPNPITTNGSPITINGSAIMLKTRVMSLEYTD